MRRKQDVDTVIKKIKKLVSEKKVAEAQKLVPAAYKALDKAAKEHTIKKGAADRKKSRIMGLIARAK